jgi:dTDP-4-dehydrorhamnose 3,5-epimerase
MNFLPTPVDGAFVIEPTPARDHRGFFARTWDFDVLRARGLDTNVHAMAVTHNIAAGTLRGMHYQTGEFAESKFVRVTRGAIFDVALDLRKGSPTYLKWHGEVLSAENHRQFYIPKGCAHGYLTLTEDSEMAYVLTSPFSTEHARGVRYNDPRFGIRWPGEVKVIAPRDANYGDYVS